WCGVTRELKRWIYGGGKVLPGLVVRRVVEVQLIKSC
ncbi:MAG: glycoside hydrolase family protein, partial [Candidatus Limnocylindrus sp.]